MAASGACQYAGNSYDLLWTTNRVRESDWSHTLAVVRVGGTFCDSPRSGLRNQPVVSKALPPARVRRPWSRIRPFVGLAMGGFQSPEPVKEPEVLRLAMAVAATRHYVKAWGIAPGIGQFRTRKP